MTLIQGLKIIYDDEQKPNPGWKMIPPESVIPKVFDKLVEGNTVNRGFSPHSSVTS